MITGSIMIALVLAVQGAPTTASNPKDRTHPSPAPTATSAQLDAMRRDIQALTVQISGLRATLAERPKFDVAAFNANVARLQLVNQELDRLRKLRDEVKAKMRSAQSQGDDARYRLSNIQSELIYAGGLDRQANEDRIRRELERQMEEAQSEESEATQHLSELDLQISQTEQVAEKLRRRLKIDYTQVDVPDEESPAPEAPPAGQPDQSTDTTPNE